MCEFVMCLFWDRKKQEIGALIAVQLSLLNSAARTHTHMRCREWNSSSLNRFHPPEGGSEFTGFLESQRASPVSISPLQHRAHKPACVCFHVVQSGAPARFALCVCVCVAPHTLSYPAGPSGQFY